LISEEGHATRRQSAIAAIAPAGATQRCAATGPAQLLIVFAVDHSDFRRDVIAELERVHNEDAVRVIDALAVYKHADGEIELQQFGPLGKDQPDEANGTIRTLIGLDVEGEEGAEMAAPRTEVFSDATSWGLLEEIPTGSAAALVLVQHHWAVPLHDAIASVGWFRISDGFIVSPLDLDEIRLIAG
jgi:hypothetical protein